MIDDENEDGGAERAQTDDEMEAAREAAFEETVARNGAHLRVALDTMRGDLRSGILDRMRGMPKPWTVLSEFEQNTMIQSIDRLATNMVRQCLAMVAGQGFESTQGVLIQAKMKNALQIQIDFSRHDRLRHAIQDAVGEEVTIVLVNAEAFMGERESDEPEPDQPALIDGEGNVATFRGKDDGEGGGGKRGRRPKKTGGAD